MSRRQLIQLVGLGIVLSAIGIAIALSIHWFPTQASSQAKRIDTLWDVLLIASVPIFVLVELTVLYSVWKFRMKPGEELKDGPPIHGNTKLEVVWTTIPALLLIGLCSYAYVVLLAIERKPGGREMVVNVTGQQFAWSFQYPGEKGAKPFKSDELYLPVDQSVKFNVRSVDVIHDFWVPEFRVKIDAVPGLTTSYRVKPTRSGDYTVVCAELCGLGHSTMRQSVHVLPGQQFKAWASKQSSASTPSPS